jgi:hypothetical protein
MTLAEQKAAVTKHIGFVPQYNKIDHLQAERPWNASLWMLATSLEESLQRACYQKTRNRSTSLRFLLLPNIKIFIDGCAYNFHC